jgi:hypothetical protein
MMFVSLFGHLLRNYLSLWGYVVVFQTAAMFRRPDMAKKMFDCRFMFYSGFYNSLVGSQIGIDNKKSHDAF